MSKVFSNAIKAVKKGKLKPVIKSLDKGAPLNEHDYGPGGDAKTLIHYAICKGHFEIVKVLLARGANLNAQTSRGFTPLHQALAEGEEEIALYLLANGADPNATTFRRTTCTELAVPLGQRFMLRWKETIRDSLLRREMEDKQKHEELLKFVANQKKIEEERKAQELKDMVEKNQQGDPSDKNDDGDGQEEEEGMYGMKKSNSTSSKLSKMPRYEGAGQPVSFGRSISVPSVLGQHYVKKESPMHLKAGISLNDLEIERHSCLSTWMELSLRVYGIVAASVHDGECMTPVSLISVRSHVEALCRDGKFDTMIEKIGLLSEFVDERSQQSILESGSAFRSRIENLKTWIAPENSKKLFLLPKNELWGPFLLLSGAAFYYFRSCVDKGSYALLLAVKDLASKLRSIGTGETSYATTIEHYMKLEEVIFSRIICMKNPAVAGEMVERARSLSKTLLNMLLVRAGEDVANLDPDQKKVAVQIVTNLQKVKLINQSTIFSVRGEELSEDTESSLYFNCINDLKESLKRHKSRAREVPEFREVLTIVAQWLQLLKKLHEVVTKLDGHKSVGPLSGVIERLRNLHVSMKGLRAGVHRATFLSLWSFFEQSIGGIYVSAACIIMSNDIIYRSTIGFYVMAFTSAISGALDVIHLSHK